jgi:hypothetical protein
MGLATALALAIGIMGAISMAIGNILGYISEKIAGSFVKS